MSKVTNARLSKGEEAIEEKELLSMLK